MKQRFRKLFSLVAAGVLAATLFATPASTADRVEDGNAAFEEVELIESETPDKLWAEFVARFGGGSELSDEEEFPYELRFFTAGGEERFAIYDTRSGRAAAGWQGSTGKWQYYFADGTRASGWENINKLDYYFNPFKNDYMVHGWLTQNNKYFMGTPGQMDSGAKYIYGWLNDKEAGGTDANPIWYYFPSSGAMYRGWLTDKDSTYYMGSDGIMKTGWLTLSQRDYYFDKSSGAMATGICTIGRVTYIFDKNGVCVNRDPLESSGRAHYILVADDLGTENYAAVNNEISYINKAGYRMDYSRYSLNSQKIYGYLPYSEVVFLHGHGAPGRTTVTDNNSTTYLYYTYNFDDPNRYKNRWLNDTSSRNISDYVDRTLSDVKFFYFLSCYSATTEHHPNEPYSVDKSCLKTVIEKGARSGLGYRYKVRGAEYYGEVLAQKISEGYTMTTAIELANDEYKEQHAYETEIIGDSVEYQSPHDRRNQVFMGLGLIQLKTNNQKSIASSIDSRLSYDTAQAGEKDLLGRKVYYAGTSKELTSSTYSLLNMDDICMTTLVYENETERIKVDSEGRLKGYRDLTVDIPDEVTASKTDEEITKIVEAYMAEKLPMEQCKVSQITLTFLGYQVMLHSENADISEIEVMVNGDGRVRYFTIQYDDTISVTEEEEAYVRELVEQNVEERYPDRKEYEYRLRYRMVEKQKVAEAIITVVDVNGDYVPYDLMIGID